MVSSRIVCRVVCPLMFHLGLCEGRQSLAQSPCSYTAQVIPEMDCGFFGGPINPIAINNSGVVVLLGDNCSNGSARSFWWKEGLKELQPIPLPPGILGLVANDISDDGLVVGGMGGFVGNFGFIFDINTQQFIAQIPAPTGGNIELTAINQTGLACGWRKTNASDPDSSTAIIYEIATGQLIDLGTLGGISSSAGDINNNGAVTGYVKNDLLPHPFLWEDGKVEVLSVPSDYSHPTVNDNGVVVGTRIVLIPENPFQHAYAFSWQSGNLTELGMLSGDTDSSANDINEVGVILGHSTYWSVDKFTSDPVIWVNGMLYNLTNQIVGMSPNTIIDLVSAMNDAGQIVGFSHTPGTANDVATVLVTPIAKTGDVTGNCAVDVDDLLRVINEWGRKDFAADINGDGTVDALDLAIVIENWS